MVRELTAESIEVEDTFKRGVTGLLSIGLLIATCSYQY